MMDHVLIPKEIKLVRKPMRPITIKVCGNETITLISSETLRINEMPSDTLTVDYDVSTLF